MKTAILLCATAALAAVSGCSSREADLRGTLGDGWRDQRLFVSADGVPGRVEIVGDTFALAGIPAGPVILRIGSEDEEVARMEIRDLKAGASLSLERIRRVRGRELAFPSAVRIDGADGVTVNGIRMADPGALPRRVEAGGVVLALSRDEGAILVRPGDDGLPDLPVVVTDSTEVLDASGEAASLRRLSPGDSVHVVGRTASGYLYAERITLGGAAAPALAEDARSTRDPERERDAEEAAEETRGGDRGEGRGRRDDRDARIPEGHRPPPGECRDWVPGLPPGQQPPPRKC